jgi:hypothetical protein
MVFRQGIRYYAITATSQKDFMVFVHIKKKLRDWHDSCTTIVSKAINCGGKDRMWKCINGCEGITEVIAQVEDEQIMVDAKTGKATNRFVDGVKGVTPAWADLAEVDESPICPECLSECDWVKE